ncbi:MAG: VacJ family lipoprotein [Deltaproteobacteria bacterium]|nr:MAG: VacJ family lipoprotein [Deltaproteobacteria bacterium]
MRQKMNQNKTKEKSFVELTVALIMLITVSIAATAATSTAATGQIEPVAQQDQESDPWEPFNSKMFWFDHDVLDRYVLKPVARAWNFVIPEVVQRSLRNAIDNTNMPSRLVNSLAQGKFVGAGREVARFTINTSIGVGGLIDLAKDGFGIEKSDEDTGQTLGFYGVGPGPYLVLPFLPPTDVRDGLGSIVDAAMNPLNYILPFAAGADGATTTGTLAGIAFTDAVNRRSLNLELYEGVEETVIDLYSAVRNAYLQKREAQIKQ